MKLAESDISHKLVDTAGNVHFLSTGEAAARMIANGQMPELFFAECQTMHRHLDELGLFHTIKSNTRHCSRAAMSTVRYVVYQGPTGQSEQPAPRYRVLTTWSPYSHAAYSKEMNGWGNCEGDDLFVCDSPSFEQFFSPFRAVIQIPVAFDHLDQKSILSAGSLNDLALLWKAQGRLFEHMDFESATAEPDPVYKYTGTAEVIMKVHALDESHARFIVNVSAKPLLDELVCLLRCQNRPEVRMESHIETCAKEDLAQQAQVEPDMPLPAPMG